MPLLLLLLSTIPPGNAIAVINIFVRNGNGKQDCLDGDGGKGGGVLVLRQASTSSKVVLPAPLAPMRAVRTPGRKKPVILCSSCNCGLPLSDPSLWPFKQGQSRLCFFVCCCAKACEPQLRNKY
jgi:hypothetical protein